LKALGVEAVAVSQPGSTEVYKDFRHPYKFDGVLEPLWRDGGDVLYRVSQPHGLAHVMRSTDLCARTPASGLDVDPLRPYASAIENPEFPVSPLVWNSAHSATIQTALPRDGIVSIQIAWHPGWHAEVNGHPEPILKDALGFMYLQPSADGPIQIAVTYDGGTEMRLARWLSAIAAVLLALGCLFFR
jgi:hypothetical protein